MGNMGEKAAGMGKEALGKMTGDTDKEREGEHQQQKGQKADEADRLEDAAADKRQEEAGHAGEEARRG